MFWGCLFFCELNWLSPYSLVWLWLENWENLKLNFDLLSFVLNELNWTKADTPKTQGGFWVGYWIWDGQFCTDPLFVTNFTCWRACVHLKLFVLHCYFCVYFEIARGVIILHDVFVGFIQNLSVTKLFKLLHSILSSADPGKAIWNRCTNHRLLSQFLKQENDISVLSCSLLSKTRQMVVWRISSLLRRFLEADLIYRMGRIGIFNLYLLCSVVWKMLYYGTDNLFWIWLCVKGGWTSSQMPKYLWELTNCSSDPSSKEILRGHATCGKYCLKTMHFVLFVFKRR